MDYTDIAARQRLAALRRSPLATAATLAPPQLGGPRLDGTQGGPGDQRLDGTQGQRGDYRLDGSQNRPLSSLAAPTDPMAPASNAPMTASGALPGTQDALFQAQSAALDRGESYANGGKVVGPGTGTSDSIAARLSNGERVIPADVAAKPENAKILDAMMKAHKPVAAPGMANGGIVRLDDQPDDPLKLASGAYGGAFNPLGNVNDAASAVGNAYRSLASAYTRGQQPKPVAPTVAAPLASRVAMPNATAGQAQVRASDNAIADNAPTVALQDAALANPPKPINYATAGNGFIGRDAIRGGAAIGQPQGVGGTPGTVINSDYGYGDNISALANQAGKFNSFSGVGGTGNQAARPNPADAIAGAARAQADKQSLADVVRGQRTDLDQGTLAALANKDALTANTNAQTADLAAKRPAALAQLAAQAGQTAAQTGLTTAQTGQTQAATATAQQALKQSQKISALGDQLGAATDPAKRTNISNQILTMLGKDPKTFQAIHAAGGVDPNDPTGMRKLSDNVVIFNNDTGQAQVVPIGQNKPPSAGEAMDAIKQAAGDTAKIQAIRQRYLNNGGDPAQLK